LPFDAKSAWEWATLHMTAAPKAIEAAPNGSLLPESMRAAVMHALAKQKDQRFATIGDFVDRFTGKSGPSHAEVAQRKPTSAHEQPARAGTAGMPQPPPGPAPAGPPVPVAPPPPVAPAAPAPVA